MLFAHQIAELRNAGKYPDALEFFRTVLLRAVPQVTKPPWVLHANVRIHRTANTDLNRLAWTIGPWRGEFRTSFLELGLAFLEKLLAYVRSFRPSTTHAATENGNIPQS